MRHRLDSDMPEGVEVINSTLLFLRPLHRNDSGVYRCEVANDINLRSRDVRILIQGKWSYIHRNTADFSSLRKHVTGGITVCDIALRCCITVTHSVHTGKLSGSHQWCSVLTLIILDLVLIACFD